jgi:hypothetical protein
MRKVIIVRTIAIIAASVAVLVYIASIGGFDPSKRIISDTVEGTETKIQESPAPPSHPAFPPDNSVQDKSSSD